MTFSPLSHVLLEGILMRSHPHLKANLAGTNKPSLSSTTPWAMRHQLPASCLNQSGYAFLFLINKAPTSILFIIKDKQEIENRIKTKIMHSCQMKAFYMKEDLNVDKWKENWVSHGSQRPGIVALRTIIIFSMRGLTLVEWKYLPW